MIINSKQLGKLIREARKARGWSQRRLAEECGVTQPTIGNVERADHSPNWDTARTIINTLGITSAQLEGGKDGA